MLRVLVLSLSLLALAVLLSSAVISYLGVEQDDSGGLAQPIPDSAGRSESQNPQGSNLTRPSPRPSAGTSYFDGVGPTESSDLSTNVASAIESQVAFRLEPFIGNLAGGDQRRDGVRAMLKNAYADALVSSVSPLGGQNIDPNFVVNAMAQVLDGAELTQLETFLEQSSRETFVETYSSQVDLVSPDLAADNKQLLLETLFTETYGATNPDGNATGSTQDYLAKQLDAIRITRDSLRGTLEAGQFDLANEFLSEQEAGLNVALGIFAAPAQ